MDVLFIEIEGQMTEGQLSIKNLLFFMSDSSEKQECSGLNNFRYTSIVI